MRGCAVCGESLEGRSRRAKFCSDRCRKRNQRAGGTRPAVLLNDRGNYEPSPGLLSNALTEEFRAAGVMGSSRAAQALLLAQRLDQPMSDSASAVAALSKELDRLRLEVLKATPAVEDPLDEMARKRREREQRAG